MSTLSLRAIKKQFERTEVLHGIDLEVAQGEFVVFVGPSGCGKSTLLRCIAGLEEISSGELLIDGQAMNDVPPAERGLAMVFQSYALYPHMTVAENMSFGLRLANTPKAEIERAVAAAAEVLRITPLLQRYPAQLSGGQRQRVAIGRAIVRRPGIFLFDEPLSNLDAALRTEMRVEMARLHATLGATIIYVTHDQAEAMTLANRIVVFNGGRIEQSGPPLALYRRPANLFVAGFLGSPKINLLPATVLAASSQGLHLELGADGELQLPVNAGGLKVGDKLTLGLRPEQLMPTVAGGSALALHGSVQMLEHLGDVAYLHVLSRGGARLIARAPADTALQAGHAVSLGFGAADALVFDSEGRALAQPS
ncbi:ABC transporter ATP-binding protein [Paucibacter sp. JuS9]|uniref:ABC transporter ATP-binding protein n=1 Tax=Paucibacter sp. JuS9 TaxID=3228748 RepID=UPI003757346A